MQKPITILRLILAIFIFMVFCEYGHTRSRNDGIIEYPDGAYGMDIGGGYETMPTKAIAAGQEELLMPAGYREDYKDTRYGAMTQRGFVLFPGFKFPAAQRAEEKKKAEEIEEYIFHASTTSANDSLFRGVSGPEDYEEEDEQ
ncbi:MAG: hypothetical protein P9L88_05450 [Candidatus Tantalella remota]|nr:hypothetical protein [Candidatus Tantalella remota]